MTSLTTRPAEVATPPVRKTRRRRTGRASSVLLFLLALAASAFVLLPIAIIAFTAFKPVAEVNAYPPTLLAEVWTLDNFTQIFAELPFGRLVVNSFIFAGGVTAFALLFDSLAAYALASP